MSDIRLDNLDIIQYPTRYCKPIAAMSNDIESNKIYKSRINYNTVIYRIL